ncbi:Serine/threonine-protein phosphatase 2A activator [Trichoplax sp. H2]|nr:Serine/threonine-protein phosphatase 2A activator [Trichoplax sp. H2]|eukprot:RDD45373.1 Serine/threonine-protein phosphatase 2A activator [Trichoplax sp. H2]
MATNAESQASDVIKGIYCFQMLQGKTFIQPKREILSMMDMAKWLQSSAYAELLGFIQSLNMAIRNKKISDDFPKSEATKQMLQILDTLDQWTEEIKPIDQPQRFGNAAFRDWRNRLCEKADDLITPLLPDDAKESIIELKAYWKGITVTVVAHVLLGLHSISFIHSYFLFLIYANFVLEESFGNATRIDYGSGHELSFVAFLFCLCKLEVFHESDCCSLVLQVFNRYLDVVRNLQSRYRMEPAGSHGVWGLDDFQFLSYLWGSSQLIDHPTILPKSFVDPKICQENAHEYMFLDCINFINKMKTGPFAEHSNQLWGISGVPYWTKVNSGLIKMFKAEVVGKFPVVQHFVFGSLLSIAKYEVPRRV